MDWLKSETFKGRSVLITGHTGFKGSWLAIWLDRLGAKVSGYSLAPPSEPNNFSASRVREMLVEDVEGDIRDADRLTQAMEEADPDVVFHLAAQSLVRTSYTAPRETFEVNVLGAAAVLDVVRARRKPCVVVVVTSDKCYENREQVWGYRETDTLGGHDPYSASKGALEILVACYRRSFFPPQRLAQHGVKLATARAGNVIGGGDWANDRIVPDAVRSLAAGYPVSVRNPRAVRPWQHVLESLSGYLAIAARMLQSDDPAWCDAWNFGPAPGRELSVADLVDRFVAAWGGGRWTDASGSNRPHEAGVLRLNIDKSLVQLGWSPTWTPDEAIARTAQWYRHYYESDEPNMRDSCKEDIEAFQSVRASDEASRSHLMPNMVSLFHAPAISPVLQ